MPAATTARSASSSDPRRRHVSAMRSLPPFGIEVVAFGDEEGSRFPSTLPSSAAMAGHFDPQRCALTDLTGITFEDALRGTARTPAKIPSAAYPADVAAAYVEVHIEQGPVLEVRSQPLGVVTGDRWTDPLAGHRYGRGRPRRHRADGPAPRRAHGGGRDDPRGGSDRPRPRARCHGRDRRPNRGPAGRRQHHPGVGRASPSICVRDRRAGRRRSKAFEAEASASRRARLVAFRSKPSTRSKRRPARRPCRSNSRPRFRDSAQSRLGFRRVRGMTA